MSKRLSDKDLRDIESRIGHEEIHPTECQQMVDEIRALRKRRRKPLLTATDREALDNLCNLLSSMPMDTGDALGVIGKLRGRA